MSEPNKNKPPFSQKELPEETESASGTPLDLSAIQAMFEDDSAALLEFFEALLEDLEVVRQDFVNAANTLSYKGFQDAAHKVKSFVRIFHPTGLVDAMELAKSMYKNEEWEKLPAVNQHILEEIARATEFLRETMKPGGG